MDNWYTNEKLSIDDADVINVMEELITDDVINKNDLVNPELQYKGSSATRFPVVFIIDTSTSLAHERENLNHAIESFINDCLDSNTVITSGLDFSIICFGEKVYVKRPFGFLSETDRALCKSKYSIKEYNEMTNRTRMASGLFLAWYLAEMRRHQYKKAGVPYKPPIFVLISDLQNNEKKMYKGRYLIHSIKDLINTKIEINKLGLIKTLYGDIFEEYDRDLHGERIDATSQFSKKLEELFITLRASIQTANDSGFYMPDDSGVYFESDYDDEIQTQDNSIEDAIKALFNASTEDDE